jgi:peptidoglycan/xylan/chitin deacetylase (PgdA/CDA1 family)
MNRIIKSRPFTDSPEVSSPSHYLCFIGLSDNLTNQLNLLRTNNAKAIFFLTKQELTANPAAVISILAADQSIGFTTGDSFTGGNTSTFIAEYNQCNILLNKIARTTSVHIILPNGSPNNTDTFRSTLLKSGYKLWKYNYDYSLNGLRVLSKIRWNSLIYVKSTDSATYLLDDLIVYMKKNAFGVKTASDATAAVFFNTVSD